MCCKIKHIGAETGTCYGDLIYYCLTRKEKKIPMTRTGFHTLNLLQLVTMNDIICMDIINQCTVRICDKRTYELILHPNLTNFDRVIIQCST